MGAMIIAFALAQAAAAAPLTAQQRFDAATEAASGGRCGEAVTEFTALEALPAVQKNARVGAELKVRRGGCLLALNRLAEADADLRAALAVFEKQPDMAADAAAAHLDLGRIAYKGLDYDEARRQFEIVKAADVAALRVAARVWLAHATMFEPGSAAMDYSAEALTLAQSDPASTKELISNLQTVHARAQLNAGKTAEAYAELKSALKAKGGLDFSVSANDLVTRSDLAIAAWLAGDKNAVREYLAYTGAGRWPKAPFGRAVRMDPPPCGGPGDIQPEDVAIVEFGIADDGSVTSATPIYASRKGPMAKEFARAVAQWSWLPEAVEGVPPLFRALTRLELRCSVAAERPSIAILVAADTEAWFEAQGAMPFKIGDTRFAELLTPAKEELERRKSAGGGIALAPVLAWLAANPVVPNDERRAYALQLRDIASISRAPAAVRTYAALMLAATFRQNWVDETVARYRATLREALADSEIAADPRAAAALRLLIAEPQFMSGSPSDAITLLQQVVDDQRLTKTDPYRVNALLRLASLQANAGNLHAARASYEQTGLTAQQCALLDARPRMTKTGASSSDFPMEAMRWGFEGWVRTEFDIGADGKTATPRAVIAYPPFVFRDAAVGVIRDARFEQTYRPEGGAGCGGATQSINFQLPGQRF